MKLLTAIFTLFITLSSSYPVIITNTVIQPLCRIASYRITELYLKKDPSILITRVINTDKGILYYFIDTRNLSYGISDEWNKQDFTNYIKGPSTIFSSLKLMQLTKLRPFGAFSFMENFPSDKGRTIFLTSDLCPTSKNFARFFYDSLNLFTLHTGKTVPLVIFFSGKWIESHSLDLEQIKKYPFPFTAGNHSYSHIITSKGLGSERLIFEVTNTERIMLENGLLPSYIFRFPGLMYSRSDISCLTSINILCLNANAWMGNPLKNRDILIVHSNGNALEEVESFTNLISNEKLFMGDNRIEFSDIFSYFRNIPGAFND
jgi:hypothetical protein